MSDCRTGYHNTSVSTSKGRLIATEDNLDRDYPGIIISIERARDDSKGTYYHQLCVVEVDEATQKLVVHVWADPNKEDSTHDIEVVFNS